MNPEELRKVMHDPARGDKSGGVRSNDPSSPVSEVRDGEFTHKYFDARRYDRFGEPNYVKVGATSSGAPVMNQSVVNGDDPLKLYLHKSRGKGERTPDFEKIETCLFQLPRYDPNFHPLHEILSNKNWSMHDQTRVLRQVMHYSVDVDRPSSGAITKKPLEKAFELENPEAAMLFIGHGAELNKPNIKGLKAMHHAALHGMPELLPVMAQRGGTAGLTGEGQSVADLAMLRFKTQLEKPKEWLTQDKFENSLETYYKSLGAVKKFRLHEGPWDFKAHKAKLNELTERFPQYKKMIDTMEQTLDDIEPIEGTITYPPSRAYTNPGKGFNDPVLDNFQHSWLGFMSFVDRAHENLQRLNIVSDSRNKVSTCLRNMDQLTDPAAIEYLQKNRRQLNLDFVVEDTKLNPHGDTLLTRAIRDKKYEVASQLLQLDVNMHATDKNGDTALHLLAKTCTDKEQFLLLAKQMTGVPTQKTQANAEGKEETIAGRQSLLQHDNLSNWYVPDAQGKTFIDVLRQVHPEWKPDLITGKQPDASWLQDIEKQLGIPIVDNDIPEWNVESILRLGGPEELLRIRKNADALQLTNETLPTLVPLDPLATKEERNQQVTLLFDAVSRLQTLKQRATEPEKRKEIRERLQSIVEDQDPETKMRTLLLFTDKMDELTPEQMEGQTMLMRSLSNDMKTGTAQDKSNIFSVFDEATKKVQADVINYFEAQGTLQGSPTGLDAAGQERMAEAIDDFQDTAQTFTDQMKTYATFVYGQATPAATAEAIKPPKP